VKGRSLLAFAFLEVNQSSHGKHNKNRHNKTRYWHHGKGSGLEGGLLFGVFSVATLKYVGSETSVSVGVKTSPTLATKTAVNNILC
jgi:hypothetical protein